MRDLLSESRKLIERARALRQQNKELRAELNETKQHLREARAAARRIRVPCGQLPRNLGLTSSLAEIQSCLHRFAVSCSGYGRGATWL